MEWEFSFPKKPSIDAGRDAQQDREDLKAGIRTWTDIHAELGTDTETQAFRKAMDLVAMLRAKRMAEQIYFQETGEKIILPDSYMFQFTPNANAATSTVEGDQAGQAGDGEPGDQAGAAAEPGDEDNGEPAEPGELEAEWTGEDLEEGTGDEESGSEEEIAAGDEEIEKAETGTNKNLLGNQT